MKRLVITTIAIHFLVKLFYGYISDNFYFLTMAVVLLLWVIIVRLSVSGKLKLIVNWWLFWVVNEVLKELSNITGILTSFFVSPLVKNPSEYVVFFISTAFLLYQLRTYKPE